MKKLVCILLCAVFLLTFMSACKPKEHVHTFDTKWEFDGENHWHQATCEHTEETSDKAPHEDADGNDLCDICSAPLEHVHTYASEWTQGTQTHYHKNTCGHADEPKYRKDEADHADANNDGLCDVCKYDYEHTHTYSEEWTATEGGHWHAPTCGHNVDGVDKADHVDEDNDGTCDVCGDDGGHVHTYAEEWSFDGDYHWKEVTCGHSIPVGEKDAHVDEDGDKKCDVCESTQDHFHTFDTAWTTDADKHWHKATCEHDTIVSGEGEHNGYDEDGVCDVCQRVIFELYTVNVTVPGGVGIVDKDNNALSAPFVVKEGQVLEFYISIPNDFRLEQVSNAEVDLNAPIAVGSGDDLVYLYKVTVRPVADMTVDVVANKLSGAEVILEGVKDTLTFEKISFIYKVITFDAPEAGWYTIHSLDSYDVRYGAVNATEDNSYLSGLSLDQSPYQASYQFYVDKAGPFSIKVRSFSMDAPETRTFTYNILKVEEKMTLPYLQGEGYSMPTFAPIDVVVTLPEPGLYQFTSSWTEGQTPALNFWSEKQWSINPYYIVATRANEQVTVRVKMNINTRLSVDFDWNIVKIDPVTVTTGSNSVTLEPDTTYNYVFTPGTTGTYLFEISDKVLISTWEAYNNAELGDMNGVYHMQNQGSTFELYLVAGQKINLYGVVRNIVSSATGGTVTTVNTSLKISYQGYFPDEEEGVLPGVTATFTGQPNTEYAFTMPEGTQISINGGAWQSGEVLAYTDKNGNVNYVVKNVNGSYSAVVLSINVKVWSFDMTVSQDPITQTMLPGKNYHVNLLGSKAPGQIKQYILSWSDSLSVTLDGVKLTSPAKISSYGPSSVLVITYNGSVQKDIAFTLEDGFELPDFPELSLGDTTVSVTDTSAGQHVVFQAETAGTYLFSGNAADLLVNYVDADGNTYNTLPILLKLEQYQVVEMDLMTADYQAGDVVIHVAKEPAFGPVISVPDAPSSNSGDQYLVLGENRFEVIAGQGIEGNTGSWNMTFIAPSTGTFTFTRTSSEIEILESVIINNGQQFVPCFSGNTYSFTAKQGDVLDFYVVYDGMITSNKVLTMTLTETKVTKVDYSPMLALMNGYYDISGEEYAGVQFVPAAKDAQYGTLVMTVKAADGSLSYYQYYYYYDAIYGVNIESAKAEDGTSLSESGVNLTLSLNSGKLSLGFNGKFTRSLTAHTHTYEGTYVSDKYNHWNEATCIHNHSDKVAHVDANDDGKCDVCAAVTHEHTYSELWQSNVAGHWHASTCGHEGTAIEAHKDDNGDKSCDVCGFEISGSFTSIKEIMDAAYALESGATLADGPYTLSGVITNVDTAWSSQYNNITVTMKVDGDERTIMAFRLKSGEGTDASVLRVGDKITVTGQITNYNGTIEFASGCTLDAYEQGKLQDLVVPEGLTDAQIVDLAYTLQVGQKFASSVTLTGTVVAIDTVWSEQYGNISVIISVEGTDNTILCFRLKSGEGTDASTIAVDDTITVTGIIKNYNGTIEFDANCVLDAHTAQPIVLPGDTSSVQANGTGVLYQYIGRVESTLAITWTDANAKIEVITDGVATEITSGYVFHVESGEGVVFVMYTADGAEGTYDVTIGEPEAAPVEGFPLGENSVQVPEYGEVTDVFVAPVDGTYVFAPASGETNAYISIELGMSSQIMELEPVEIELAAGDRVSVIVMTYDYAADTIDFTISLKGSEGQTPVEGFLVGNNSVQVPEYGEVTDVFVAPESGTYVFAPASGETNAYISIEFGMSSQVMELEPVEIELAAGDRVSVIVMTYDYAADTIDFTISLKGAEEQLPANALKPGTHTYPVNSDGIEYVVVTPGKYILSGSNLWVTDLQTYEILSAEADETGTYEFTVEEGQTYVFSVSAYDYDLTEVVLTLAAADAHQHTYASEWSYDENGHWQEYTCGCTEAPAVSSHTGYTMDGVCDVCGYVLFETNQYYIAGTQELTGSNWDPAGTQMTITNSGLYEHTFTGVPAGKYDFKVTDGTWNNSWGMNGGNYVFSLLEAADVTIIFDPTEPYNPVSVKVNGAYAYIVAGSESLTGSNWDPTDTRNLMTEADGQYYILYRDVEPGTYEFKITIGSWAKDWGVDGGNYVLTVQQKSNVCILFDGENIRVETWQQENLPVILDDLAGTGSIQVKPETDTFYGEFTIELPAAGSYIVTVAGQGVCVNDKMEHSGDNSVVIEVSEAGAYTLYGTYSVYYVWFAEGFAQEFTYTVSQFDPNLKLDTLQGAMLLPNNQTMEATIVLPTPGLYMYKSEAMDETVYLQVGADALTRKLEVMNYDWSSEYFIYDWSFTLIESSDYAADSQITIPAEGYYGVVYTPDQGSVYKFTMVDDEGKAISGVTFYEMVEENGQLSMVKLGSNPLLLTDLYQQITLYIRADAEISGKLTCEYIGMVPEMDLNGAYVAASGSTQYIFIAPYTGEYLVTIDGANQVAGEGFGNNYVTGKLYSFEAGQIVKYKVNAASGQVTIRFAHQTYAFELSAGSAAQTQAMRPGKEYTVTLSGGAASGGLYSYILSWTDTNVSVKLGEQVIVSGQVLEGLEVGGELTIVYNGTGSEPVDVAFTLEDAIGTPKLVLGENDVTVIKGLYGFDTVVYGFIAPADGTYVILSDNYDAGLLDASGTEIPEFNASGYEFTLAEGEEIKLYFTCYDYWATEDVTYTVVIKEKGALTGQELTLGNNSVEVSVVNFWSQYTEVYFVAAEAGTYVLKTAEGEEDADIYNYDDTSLSDTDYWIENEVLEAGYAFTLEAGEAVVFYVGTSQWIDGAYVIDLVIEKA